MKNTATILFGVLVAIAFESSLLANAVNFNTGAPDGKIGTGSRPSGPGQIEIESADDFILTQEANLNHATFTGLLTGGAQVT
ncbi:MAG: PEP-CTERM sorting domain-containing protein, partial [Bryobacteraceae bacterium]